MLVACVRRHVDHDRTLCMCACVAADSQEGVDPNAGQNPIGSYEQPVASGGGGGGGYDPTAWASGSTAADV